MKLIALIAFYIPLNDAANKLSPSGKVIELKSKKNLISNKMKMKFNKNQIKTEFI